MTEREVTVSSVKQIIKITNTVQGLGEVPNGLVLYMRENTYQPFVVHSWTDHRSFGDGTALSLYHGDSGLHSLRDQR